MPPSRPAALRVDLNPPGLPLGKASVLLQIVGRDPSETKGPRGQPCLHLPGVPKIAPAASWSPLGAYRSESLAGLGQPPPTPPWAPAVGTGTGAPRNALLHLQLHRHPFRSRSALMGSPLSFAGWQPCSPNKAAHLSIREFSGTRREPRIPDATHPRGSPFPHHPLGAQISQ